MYEQKLVWAKLKCDNQWTVIDASDADNDCYYVIDGGGTFSSEDIIEIGYSARFNPLINNIIKWFKRWRG